MVGGRGADRTALCRTELGTCIDKSLQPASQLSNPSPHTLGSQVWSRRWSLACAHVLRNDPRTLHTRDDDAGPSV